MTKKILSFIFFILVSTVSGQEAGVLIKTTLFPFQGWNGSHGGHHSITVGSNTVAKGSNTTSTEKIEYDFFYVTDNPTVISCIGGIAGNKDDIKCNLEEDIPYDKFSFEKNDFYGCIADSEIMGIYIPQPEPGKTNETCPREILTLKGGWNWQYKLDNGAWKDFPSQYQAKNTISFYVKDLEGYTNQQYIHFQAGYQTNFTNTRTYKIIGCSPELAVNPPSTDPVKCYGKSTGSVTLTFKPEPIIKDGDKFLITLYSKNDSTLQFLESIFVNKTEISNNSYTWTNRKAGTYVVKYQTQSTLDDNVEIGSSALTSDAFVIETSSKFTYQATPIQPKCNTDDGGILITPDGGTSPYFYMINNDNNWHEFTGPITIPITTDGSYQVKVVDKYNCIEEK